MNWDELQIQASLCELQELLFLTGRDSRIVRWAQAYSRFKKKQIFSAQQGLRALTQTQPKDPRKLRVFFWLPGGLGDAACARRVIDAYRTILPDALFEIYSPVPQAVQTVFAGIPGVVCAQDCKKYWKNYDLAVLACLCVKFLWADEKRLAALAPDFLPVFLRAVTAQKKLDFLLEDPFLTEAALGRWLLKQGGRRFDLLSFTSGADLPHDAQEQLPVCLDQLSKWGLTEQTYLTFHDGSDGETLPTRMWPRSSWKTLLTHIKNSYPHIKIVQLGVKNNPVYTQADVCLCGQTTLTDLPTLLAGACIHIDTESGLVHLAQYLKTRSVVLFGPSDKYFFAYQKNQNLAAENCGGCMWMQPDWMRVCPLQKDPAACMQAIPPRQVFSAVQHLLQTDN